MLFQLRADDLFVAEDMELERAILAARTGDAGDDRRRPGVASHCINRDPRACVHVRPPRASFSRQASVDTISRPL